VVHGQRVPALRFGDPRVMALLDALVVFRLSPAGFTTRMLREHLAPLLGAVPATMTAGAMTYDLRRLRLHALITRVPHTHRYTVTSQAFRIAVFLRAVYARILRPGIALTITRRVGRWRVTMRAERSSSGLSASVGSLQPRASSLHPILFHRPLIKPCMTFSVTRLSNALHRVACSARPPRVPLRRKTPSSRSHDVGYRVFHPRPTCRCCLLAKSARRSWT
jgi:hypothetical protein